MPTVAAGSAPADPGPADPGRADPGPEVPSGPGVPAGLGAGPGLAGQPFPHEAGTQVARTVPARAAMRSDARRRSQVVLCVHNLSRFAQPVQLDLAAWAGRRPVEVLGRVPFPEIGTEPYTLVAAPHGYLWFELVEGPVFLEDLGQ